MRKIFACSLLFGWAVVGLNSWAAQTAAKKATTQTKAAAQKTASAKKTAGSKAPAKKTVAKAAPKKRTATKAPAKSTAKKRTASRRTPVKRVTWRNRQTAPTPERYKEIQQALVDKGYLEPEAANGSWGVGSAAALKKFQAAQNIPATGKISSLSLIALGLGPKHETPVPAKPPEASTPAAP